MRYFLTLTAALLSVGLAQKVSTDGSCGGSTGLTCSSSSFGSCCSSYGWCGSTSAYCGTGCQAGSGSCTSTGSGTSSSITKATSSSIPSPTTSASSTVNQCLDSKNVPYKRTSDVGFAKLSEAYNQRVSFTPVVVVLPTTNQHVQDAVVCAGQTGIKVQAKSGGHSYASFSSGGKDGSMSELNICGGRKLADFILVVDLQSLQNVALDKSTGIVQVGGGVRLGNLADGIWNQGKAALSHGTCTCSSILQL
jgi:hypothetical protein